MRAPPATNPRLERGFTLLELAVVVLVVAALAAVMLPQLGSGDERQLDAALRRVADAVRYARQEALRRGGYVGVNADPATGLVRLFSYDPAAASPVETYDVLNPLDKRPWSLQLGSGPLHGRVSIAWADFYSGGTVFQKSMAFDPRARPVLLSGATVSPYTWGAIALAAGPVQRSVVIDPETGRVTLQ